MLKKTILWMLVILCMTLIFYFSSQEAIESDQTSTSFMAMVIRLFDADNSLDEASVQKIAEELNYIVRKGAHFSIYAVLGGLIFLLIRQYKKGFLKPLAGSVALSMLYACSDEIHQIFVPGRAGRISDVLIDTTGALCGAGVLMLLFYILHSKKQYKNNI